MKIPRGATDFVSMKHKLSSLASAVESLLFVHGEPMEVKRLAKLLDADFSQIEEAVGVLRERCSDEASGLSLVENHGTLALTTRTENAEVVSKLLHKDTGTRLSPAVLETLTVVAYRHPVSRHEIERIRGVNSSFALRNLLVRGLIERIEDPNDSRAFLYRPSTLFLESAGCTSLSQLPDYAQLSRDTGVVSQETKTKSV